MIADIDALRAGRRRDAVALAPGAKLRPLCRFRGAAASGLFRKALPNPYVAWLPTRSRKLLPRFVTAAAADSSGLTSVGSGAGGGGRAAGPARKQAAPEPAVTLPRSPDRARTQSRSPSQAGGQVGSPLSAKAAMSSSSMLFRCYSQRSTPARQDASTFIGLPQLPQRVQSLPASSEGIARHCGSSATACPV